MRNYLKAELYRNFHRKALWMTIGILMLCATVTILGFWWYNQSVNSVYGLENFLFVVPPVILVYIFLMMIFTDMSIVEEFKNNTIKNIVTSGLTREKIYVCKVIESIILMLICSFSVSIGTMCIGYFVLGIQEKELFQAVINELIPRGSMAVLLYMGAIAMLSLLSVVIKNGTGAAILYVFIILYSGNVFDLLGKYVSPIFLKFDPFILPNQLSLLTRGSNLTNKQLILAGSVGVGYTIIFTVIGVLVLKKKDL